MADGETSMMVYLFRDGLDESHVPPFQVKSGQRISFTATRIGRYDANLQIAAATDWILHSQNNLVTVFEPTNELGECPSDDAECQRTEVDTYMHRMVRATGILGEMPGLGAAYPCGAYHDVGASDTETRLNWLFFVAQARLLPQDNALAMLAH